MQFLSLPERTKKPRTIGLTCLIDNGLPTDYFVDVLKSHNHFIDVVKFGWGTSAITRDLEHKISTAKAYDIDVHFGGTFFEKAVLQKKLDEYIQFSKDNGCTYLEISNGTIDLTNTEKADYISELSKKFNIFSEVGFKDSQRSLQLHPAKWVEFIMQDLAAGAEKVILEARESGKSGIAREDGELRFGLIEEILNSDIDYNQLVFEAPTKSLQVYFIKRLHSNVNLANIAFNDVIALETLRLGLRGDTLLSFEEEGL